MLRSVAAPPSPFIKFDMARTTKRKRIYTVYGIGDWASKRHAGAYDPPLNVWFVNLKRGKHGVPERVKVTRLRGSADYYHTGTDYAELADGRTVSSLYMFPQKPLYLKSRDRIGEFHNWFAGPKKELDKIRINPMAKSTKKVAKRKTPRKRKMTLAQIFKKAAKEKRPTRFSYDRAGNIVGVYVPLKHQTKAERRKATRAMISACSAGAYRQGVSPSKTCGFQTTREKAGEGLAYARWGFPRGWPKPRQVSNPSYRVGPFWVKTFVDSEGDWGYAVYGVEGEPIVINSGEPSEKIAMREGKAEARFQAEILKAEGVSLEAEGRELFSENPWSPASSDVAKAKTYVRRIRNKAKKTYAQKYLQWMLGGERGDDPAYAGLSYMGAQAVRLSLQDILYGAPGRGRPQNPQPQAYDPQEGYKFQILCRNQAYSRAWEHCDYAVDAADKKHLLENYRMGYGPGWEFKTIMLPAKYWPKAGSKNPSKFMFVTDLGQKKYPMKAQTKAEALIEAKKISAGRPSRHGESPQGMQGRVVDASGRTVNSRSKKRKNPKGTKRVTNVRSLVAKAMK